MTQAPGSKVFISYSHKDKEYLVRLQTFLKPHVRDGEIPLWDDTLIKPGDEWYMEIGAALAKARVAILLVSTNFLASDFIASEELPRLLAANKERGLVILPVVLTPCNFPLTTLSRFQTVNKPESPLSGLSQYEQDRIWEQLVESVLKALKSRRPIDAHNPYPGLLPFTANWASHFYGRDKEQTRLVNLITEDHERLILIQAASGAGKSSLVGAGVMPELMKRGWKTILCHPGEDAFFSLVSAIRDAVPNFENLLRVYLHSSLPNVSLQLREHPALIKDVLKLAAGEGGWRQESGLLLFIDQFEELFSLTSKDPHLPPAFMHLLNYIASAEEELPNLHLIFTMRSEYMEQLLGYEWEHPIYSFLLLRPGRRALLQVIEKPMEDVGLEFENPDLPEIIVEEAAAETSALVLISFFMKQFYDRCAGEGLLTDRAYNDLGGIKGAISKLGDHYLEAHKDHTGPIREVFSRLIQFDPVGGTTTRRPVPLKTFSPQAHEVITDLSGLEYRLLVVRAESDSGGVAVVDIAHEAIIHNWTFLEEIAAQNEIFYRSEAELKQLTDFVGSGSVRGKPGDLDRYLDFLKGQVNPDLQGTYAARVKALVDTIFERLRTEIGREETEPDRRKDIGRELAEMVEKLKQTSIAPPMRSGVYMLGEHHLPNISWLPIGGGAVTIKTRTQEVPFAVEPFEIAQYPITVWQYQAFLKAEDGYKDHQWWQWSKRQANKRYWELPETRSQKQGNCPVRGVRWYNAVAFCHWLTAKYRQMGWLDERRVIRLPTEWEWQCAALGPEVPGQERFDYPWGPKWKANQANTSECDLLEEIAVGMFAPFTSPSGAEDMFGNVAEWCLNSHEPSPGELLLTDDQRRVLRGASYAVQGEANSAFEWRTGRTPDQPEKWAGFRVVKALPVQF